MRLGQARATSSIENGGVVGGHGKVSAGHLKLSVESWASVRSASGHLKRWIELTQDDLAWLRGGWPQLGHN